jgi:hypothetical protein
MKRWLAMMGCVTLAATGCATSASSKTAPALDRNVLLARASEQVLYRRPPEEVMGALEVLLNERGYTVLPSADPNYLRTGWRVLGDFDFSSRWSRVLVQGRKLEDGRFVVRAFEQLNTTVGRAAPHPSLGGGNRDANRGGEGANTNYVQGEALFMAPVVTRRHAELEWALLAKLEPKFAAAVERQVDVYVANHQPPEEVDETPR